jgi:hypothetical protein
MRPVKRRSGTVSVFGGPPPSIAVLADARQEIERVSDFLRNATADCARPDEIGMFVRSPDEIGRARAAAEGAGLGDQVAISVMHLAKGLEFRPSL